MLHASSRLDQAIRWDPLMGGTAASGDGFRLPVGTVTLLLADIAGSTRAWQDAPEAMAAAVARYDTLVGDALGQHGGVRPVEQGEGDSFVAAFSRASDGVAAALDLQLALHREAWPDGAALSVRIGLHTGEVQLRDEGNYIGTAINRCARVRALAHGGQTVLSRTTHDLVVDKLPGGATLVDLGLHRLRDLSRPEHVFELAHPELPSGFPPLRSLDALPNNLPAQLTTFIGRESELADIEALLPDVRLLTLVGSGGAGKTRLALQAAAAAAADYAHGTWFVDLAPIADGGALDQAVAGVFGVLDQEGQNLRDVLVRRLRNDRVLVVLDNCEQIVEACAGLVVSLLSGCPGVVVLATSREPLGVDGEVQWRVPSLSLPAEGEPAPIEALATYDAVRLFVDRALRAHPNFTVTNENAPAVAAICRRLDGIPLAIELAAARVRMLSPEQIATGLNDRFHILGVGARTALVRQQTLRASVDWSHELLSAPERVLLRRLAVFVGGFDLDAAEAVGAGGPIEANQVLDLLTSLVDKSLVLADVGGTSRYGLLETVRQYASERLDDAAERDAVAGAHLDHFHRMFAAAAPATKSSKAAVERHNLRAAFDWAGAVGRADAAAEICEALFYFWLNNHEYQEGRRAISKLLDGADFPMAARARALSGLSTFITYLEGASQGRELCEEAVRLARESGDNASIALTLLVLGNILELLDPAASVAVYDEAIARFEELGDRYNNANLLRARGLALIASGRCEAAADSFARGDVLAEETRSRYALAGNKVGAAYVAMVFGQYAAATRWLDAGVAVARESGDPWWLAFGLFLSSEVRLCQGDGPGAVAAAEEAGRVAQSTPALTLHFVIIPGVLGRALLAGGDVSRARPLLEDALRGWTAHRVNHYAEVSRSVIEVCLLDGDAAAARRWCDRLLPEARRIGNHQVAAAVLHAQGLVERSHGEADAAEACFRQALTSATACPWPAGVADALEALGGIAGVQESFVEATRLLAAGRAAHDAIGHVRFPTDQPRVDADIAAARDALGDGFDAAWAEGLAMSAADAVAYVERGRGERKRPTVGWASLTPTESKVVELVAGGLTNPQIAERLFMSRSTVKTHLAHVFDKLGVSTRSELAAQEAVRSTRTP